MVRVYFILRAWQRERTSRFPGVVFSGFLPEEGPAGFVGGRFVRWHRDVIGTSFRPRLYLFHGLGHASTHKPSTQNEAAEAGPPYGRPFCSPRPPSSGRRRWWPRSTGDSWTGLSSGAWHGPIGIDFFQVPRGYDNLLIGNSIFLTDTGTYGPYATLYL